MVIPVPVVLHEPDVKTLPADVFANLEQRQYDAAALGPTEAAIFEGAAPPRSSLDHSSKIVDIMPTELYGRT